MEEHKEARFIVETFAKQGFVAYYAGGWVRDFLLQHPSDDIDIATNAPPETIQALFPHTVPIGIAFGIVLVIVDGKPYEVATFRQDLDYKDGRRPSKVLFTTAEEDAKRRDFTINGMFYDPLREEILDYVEGKKDLEKKIIRAIGNPIERIQEDRLRMLRALRLSCRFGFRIESKTKEAILQEAKHLLSAVAIERVCQELTKAKAFGKLGEMLLLMHQYLLLETIFPSLKKEENSSSTDIEKRIAPLFLYPEKAPLIAYLVALFPNASLEAKKALCKKLKLPLFEEKFLILLEKAKDAFAQQDLYEKWLKSFETKQKIPPVDPAITHSIITLSYFYADPLSSLIIEIIATHEEKKEEFLQKVQQQKKELQPFIQRILQKKPLISSFDLEKEGVLPGKTMGILLKKAEEFSILYRTEDRLFILNLLKDLEIWPKKP